jgi:hypothetical protein
MSGWIYAVEIAPVGWVKIGRTEKLTARLAQHVAAAAFGGGSVIKVASFAVTYPDTAEDDLLAELEAHPGAFLAHGKETFMGIPFLDVVAIAERIVAPPLSPGPWPTDTEIVRLCAEAMDAAEVTRASLGHLRRLVNAPGIVTNTDLGRELRRAGVTCATVYCREERLKACGIKREWLSPAPHVSAAG